MEEKLVKIAIGRMQKYPILFAYLFGSHASGKMGPLSDIDIAVFFKEEIGYNERFRFRLKLTRELSAIFVPQVDLIVLNDAPARLYFETIKHGRVLFCRDRQRRLEMEIEITSKYLDRRYYDKRRAEILLNRIQREPVRS